MNDIVKASPTINPLELLQTLSALEATRNAREEAETLIERKAYYKGYADALRHLQQQITKEMGALTW